jgi:hypothetical protein
VLLGGGLAAGALSTGSSGAAPATMSTGMQTTGEGMPMPMPIRRLGTATWQGMKIEVRSMAPATFVVFTGTSERTVKPLKKDTMHLMVLLTDKMTNMPIPYAAVWATISKAGKIVYDERQWPMISRYMGVHYGNNVSLAGAGSYKLSVLIGPPQSARHLEYAKVWLKPHRVNFTFHWK